MVEEIIVVSTENYTLLVDLCVKKNGRTYLWLFYSQPVLPLAKLWQSEYCNQQLTIAE